MILIFCHFRNFINRNNKCMDGCFDDIFAEYLSSYKLTLAKTTNMGTIFDLRYEIVLKDAAKEKELLDMIRTRNGNLMVSCGILIDNHEEL